MDFDVKTVESFRPEPASSTNESQASLNVSFFHEARMRNSSRARQFHKGEEKQSFIVELIRNSFTASIRLTFYYLNIET